MASLYRRATPIQARILRAVAGAVRNAGDAHPQYKLDNQIARSIAKRAAGTLAAQMPEVLAASKARGFVPSSSDQPHLLTVRSNGLRHVEIGKRGVHPSQLRKMGGVRGVQVTKPLSRKRIVRELGILAGQARRSGNTERFDALRDVLRLVAGKKNK